MYVAFLKIFLFCKEFQNFFSGDFLYSNKKIHIKNFFELIDIPRRFVPF